MKISLLEIKNCLGIKELAIKPGKINIISGGNEKGKTSILETIEKALYNTERRPKFVRNGESEAEIFIELDEGIEINRKVKENGKSSLKVRKDGMRPTAPEGFLKGLLGEYAFAFNPVDFMLKSDKEQAQIILNMLPIKVSQLDAQEWFGEAPPVTYDQHGLKVCKLIEQYYYDLRTEVNRNISSYLAEIDVIKSKLPKNYDPDKWRNIELTRIYSQIGHANKVNQNRIKCQAELDHSQAKIVAIQEVRDLKVKQLEEEIKRIKTEAQNDIEMVEKNKAFAEKYLSENQEIDIKPLEEEYAHTENMKSFIALADKLAETKQMYEEDEKYSKSISSKLNTIRQKPAELLKKSKLPIDGLAIDSNNNITINGLPIKNLSTKAQVQLSIDIARTTAGELKLICIDRFESMDKNIQNEFFEEIKCDDFQYFITQVGTGDLNIISHLDNGMQINALTGELVEQN